MHDDIQRRLVDVGRAAERAAAPVGFEGIRRRARRRRRAQTLSAGVLCLAVAAGVGAAVAQVGGPGRRPGPAHHGHVHPSPTPTMPEPTRAPTPRLTARQIAENPRSFVIASSVDPHDAAQAATLWMLGPAGAKAQVGIATTTDGYRHVRYVLPPAPYARDCTDVRALGNQEFWFSCALNDFVVLSDGSVHIATSGSGQRSVPRGAVLVPMGSTGGGVGSNWVDARGDLHEVPFPGSAWLVHAPGGRIWGLSYGQTDTLVWSTDGGRGWTSRPLPPVPAGGTTSYEVVPTAEPWQMVVARGSAETMFRPHSLLVFGRATELHQKVTRIDFPVDPGAMDSAMVTPDGSLVMELYNEPDGPSGLFRGAPGRWTDLHKVLDLPSDATGRPAAARWMGSSRDSSGRPLLWAVFGSGELATSTDDGQTWATRSLR